MNPDIFLHEFIEGEKTSVYNAPHRYRVAINSHNENFASDALDLWNGMGRKVLSELCNKIRELNFGGSFHFAVAPSHTEPFNTHIKAFILKEFPQSINLTSIFTKDQNFKALGINQKLKENDLIKKIWINEAGKGQITKDVNRIILLDDVFANGNTFEAMKLAINKINPKTTFVTVTILKT